MSAPSKLVERGREAAKKKNYDYAVELYIEHLKVKPGDVEARKELRMVEREAFKVNPPGMFQRAKNAAVVAKVKTLPVSKKDPEKTMLSCEDALRADPNAVNALLKLGEAASYAQLNDVAVYAFEDALSLDRSNVEGLRLLGRVYNATDVLDKALTCFERIIKITPVDIEANNMIRDIPAKMTSRKVQGTDGGVKSYKDLIDQDAARKLEMLSARVRTPEQALERIAMQEKEINAAGGKADNKTFRLMGEWAIIAKDYEKAVFYCDKALEVEPKDYVASELKGDVKLKKLDESIKKIQEILKKNDDESMKAKLAKITKERVNFVIDEFRRRIEAHPTEAGLRFELGKAYYETDQIDEAIKQLQQSKTDARRKAESGYYLGLCFGMKKKIYHLAVKELEAAREDLYEMADLKKDITYLLARLHEAAKKPEKAVAELSAIAEVDYNFKDVTERMEKLASETGGLGEKKSSGGM
ncbi:hypothetical protein HY251_01190 [bacterium]|nr:hypothetical protein [bacterium]